MSSPSYHGFYAKKYHRKNPLERFLIDRFLNAIHDHVGRFVEQLADGRGSMLDVGCGEGFVTQWLSRRFPGLKITGIDSSEEAIVMARNNCAGEIEFKSGLIENLDAGKDSFDIVTCLETLEHVDNPSGAVDSLLKVCRIGLVVSVPNEPYFRFGNLCALRYIASLGNSPGHINHWNRAGLLKLLENARGGGVASSFPWLIGWVNK